MDHPIYRQSFEYASQHGESDAWRASIQRNQVCARAIDKAVSESNYDTYHYDLKGAAEKVIGEYGIDRVNAVLANVILTHNYDGRYSGENKRWAQEFDIAPDNQVFCNTHPYVLDGFIDKARAVTAEREKEAAPVMVGSYTVTRSILFDNDRGFAYGENPQAVEPFATWQLTNDGGKHDHYWGHYHKDQGVALTDYENRVNEYMADYPSLKVVVNPLAAAEMSTEQNYNMIDGVVNNLPPAPEPEYIDGRNIVSACNSRFEGMVAFVGTDDKVYLGNKENYDSRGHYENADHSLTHISDNKKVYHFLYGEGLICTQAEALAYHYTMEDLAEFASLQAGVLAGFIQKNDFLFDGQPFLPPDSEAFREQVAELERNGGAKPFNEYIAEKYDGKPAKAANKRPSVSDKLKAAQKVVKDTPKKPSPEKKPASHERE